MRRGAFGTRWPARRQAALAACALILGLFAHLACSSSPGDQQSPGFVRPPNIVFILADDLGYGDLGSYGQTVIRTPNLDRMAGQGMRFRQFYAGATVCAPSRSVLMTGQHGGHTWVRGNAGGDMSVQTLRAEDVTVAERLKQAGYSTALFGKWGLGDMLPDAMAGLPDVQGFDRFFGYLNQVHAHNYYPEFLWDGREKLELANVVERVPRRSGGFAGGHATERNEYAHDLIVERALQWVSEQGNQPFFLFLAATIPHANNEGTRATGNGQEVPDHGPYAERDWSDADKGQAAMITRLDADVGRLLALLAELGIDEHTVVFFSSDNGHHDEGGHDTELFDPNGPLRGLKRDLYEGGIRVPLVARWPGRIQANSVSDHVGYFGDVFNTLSELAGMEPAAGLDSISFVPTLTGRAEEQPRHEYLYWEFYERGGLQAIRRGDWKAVRPLGGGQVELFDLSADLGEANDLAAEHPETVAELVALMEAAHEPNPNWQPRGVPPAEKSEPGDGRARF